MPRIASRVAGWHYLTSLLNFWMVFWGQPASSLTVWSVDLVSYIDCTAILYTLNQFSRSRHSHQIKSVWKQCGKNTRPNTDCLQDRQICNYGRQKYEPHLLCKHLVQAVHIPNDWLWQEIHCHCVIPSTSILSLLQKAVTLAHMLNLASTSVLIAMSVMEMTRSIMVTNRFWVVQDGESWKWRIKAYWENEYVLLKMKNIHNVHHQVYSHCIECCIAWKGNEQSDYNQVSD